MQKMDWILDLRWYPVLFVPEEKVSFSKSSEGMALPQNLSEPIQKTPVSIAHNEPDSDQIHNWLHPVILHLLLTDLSILLQSTDTMCLDHLKTLQFYPLSFFLFHYYQKPECVFYLDRIHL